jgi:glycosyltransferase involved in cell wall biosynthesis
MKKVTIMIPTYNQARYVGKAIESALSQAYSNIEVVVSDDCSSDNTQEIVKKYITDDRVKYFRNEQNLGRVANYRKTLYKYASGNYVLNLDGDDWLLESNFITKAVNLLDKNKNMSCVLGDRQNFYEEIGEYKIFSNKHKPYVKEIMDGNQFFINNAKICFFFSHFSSIYRRELALKLDFYSKDILSSDFESICKLYVGRNVGYLPIEVGVWRSHKTNATNLDMEKKIENLEKFDYLYEFVLDKKTFTKKRLDKWLLENKSSLLSQEILYYASKGEVIQALVLFNQVFIKNKYLGLETLRIIFLRVCKRVLFKLKVRKIVRI